MYENTVSPQLITALSGEDIAHTVVTQLCTANYLLSPEKLPSIPDRIYADNERLWYDILSGQLDANVILTLENFLLSEWFPRSPGLYYTREAEEAREMARDCLVSSPRLAGLENIDDAERLYQITGSELPDFMYVYNPSGKISMLKGGIGSIRLRDKQIESGRVRFMSASSTLVAHEGLPIALPEDDYQKYYDIIREKGFLPCTLVGKLQWIPHELQEVYRDCVGVKQLYLLVDNIRPEHFTPEMERSPFRVSVAVTFESEYEGFRNTYASYVTFYSAIRDSLKKRTNWLENTYVKGMYQGKIVIDFDETTRQFRGARFALEKVMNHQLQADQIREYLSASYNYHPFVYSIPDVRLAERLVENLEQINRRLQMKTMETDRQAPIRILFLAANPKDTDPLRLDQEMRAIDQALLQAAYRDRFEIKQQWAVQVSDIQGHLLRHQPDIVHFSGHGSATSEIILEDDTGTSHSVSVRALSQLFSVLKDNIKCVVLNACYSEPQAKAIAEHIDCVVGMSKAIGDRAAINFAAAFYQGLGYGRDVKTAFDLGCNQIDLKGLNEQDTPKLLALTRDPGQIVFV